MRRTLLRAAEALESRLKSKRFGKLIHRLFGYHRASEVGLDVEIHCARPGYWLLGYFQSYKYADYLKKLGLLQISVQSPSESYLKLRIEAAQFPTIGIHVRRGDYLNPENATIGVLSIQYYLQALNRVQEEIDEPCKLWLFSDDSEQVSSELHAVGVSIDRVISHEALGPEEELLLMSECGGLIISNSSFSWWGAFLGKVKVVAAPQKWFRQQTDPGELIPPSWNKIESSWL